MGVTTARELGNLAFSKKSLERKNEGQNKKKKKAREDCGDGAPTIGVRRRRNRRPRWGETTKIKGQIVGVSKLNGWEESQRVRGKTLKEKK